MNIKKIKGKNVAMVIASAVISIFLALCLFALALTGSCRNYLTSEKFNSIIDSTDLSNLTFVRGDEKITFEQYVKDFVTENVETYLRQAPLSNLTGFLFPFADSITDFAVDKALSSEYVNSVVKKEVHSIFDYFLYSDYEEAKQRIKDGVTLETNVALNPENAPTFEERIEAEVKMAVFKYIEEESGISCDEIILLLSEKTVTNLKIISVLLLVVIIAINLVKPWRILLFASISLLCFNGQLHSCITDFNERYSSMQDLISYRFLSPIIEALSPYADLSLIAGIVCLVLFSVLRYFIKKKKV